MINVCQEFNANESPKQAVQKHFNSINPESVSLDQLYHKLQKPIFYVVVDGEEIIALIRGTPDRINSLVVDGAYHRQGIGESLIKKFIATAQKSGSHKIKVRSSVYAVSFYQAMGFKRTTGQRTISGLRHYPMKIIL